MAGLCYTSVLYDESLDESKYIDNSYFLEYECIGCHCHSVAIFTWNMSDIVKVTNISEN